jgi:hypothetical protein
MKTKYFYLLLVAGILLFACQKEVSQDTTSPSSPAGNDSTVLSKYIQLDTLNGRTDTISVLNFEYDNLKRITKVTSISYFNNLPDLTDSYDKSFYYYNGSDTLPSKILEVFSDKIKETDSVIWFFTRNANQVVIRDSFIDFHASPNFIDTTAITSKYTIYADSVIENYSNYNPATSSGNHEKFKHQLVRTNNNITQQISFQYLAPVYDELFTSNFQFDDKPNPFFKMDINYPIAMSADIDPKNLSLKNNILKRTTKEQFQPLLTIIYSYTYNNLNYPKTEVQYNPANPTSAIKGVYIYTK